MGGVPIEEEEEAPSLLGGVPIEEGEEAPAQLGGMEEEQEDWSLSNSVVGGRMKHDQIISKKGMTQNPITKKKN